jgi:ABC-type transport system involved in cytochrome bd biosynthesis fused ATPase/permease subunit
MASVEAAMSTVARPRLIARMWHWRYEFGLIAGVLLGTIGIGVILGPGWLIAAAAAAMAVVAAALTWPPSRQRITARA